MANTSFSVSRVQLIYAVCLPLAVLLGYLLAEPLDMGSMAAVVLVLAVLAVPILIRWHHPLLILGWNAAVTPLFVPGRPYLWMVLTLAGVLFVVLNRIAGQEYRGFWVSSVNRPLLFLLGVTMVTAWFRGGFGLNSFGASNFGSKGYYYIILAILGYFVLVSQRVPLRHAGWVAGLFFASGLTALLPNLAYSAHLNFLYYLVPLEFAVEQAKSDFAIESDMTRFFGVTLASTALYCFLLCRYGLRGTFNPRKPWRLLLFTVAALGSFFSGFRSWFLLFLLTVLAQFYFERLYRTRVLVAVAVVGIVTSALLVTNVQKLPFVVQRSLSFLPLDVHPEVRESARDTSQWRLDMWRDLLPEVPRYLFAGKGYGFDPVEFALLDENVRRGYVRPYETAMLSRDYHSGPLSVLIPLGLWGAAGFLWFLVAGFKVLYRNFSHGDPALEPINRFLLVFFVARLLLFFLIFGGFYTDLFYFTGLVGLSVSLNGGVAQPAAVPVESEEEAPFPEHLVPGRLR